jgi:hypothetical protein
MKFAALLGAIALLPIAFVVGYSAHKEPAPPAFGPYVSSELGVRHLTGQDTDDWLVVAVSGPNKGGAMDLAQALSFFPTHKAIEASAGGKVKYIEMKCQTYSNGAKNMPYTAPTVIRKCNSLVRTRKQAVKYMVDLLQPEPKS